MNAHAPEPEVEDDGFITDMSRVLRSNAAPAKPAGGDKPSKPPQSRTALYLASLKAENDADECRLAAIEAELIAVEEGVESKNRQAEAEFAATVEAAEAKRLRDTRRNTEDAFTALEALNAEKADRAAVVNARHAAIETIIKAGAGVRSPVEMAS